MARIETDCDLKIVVSVYKSNRCVIQISLKIDGVFCLHFQEHNQYHGDRVPLMLVKQEKQNRKDW